MRRIDRSTQDEHRDMKHCEKSQKEEDTQDEKDNETGGTGDTRPHSEGTDI